MLQSLPRGGCAIDIGAHKGAYTYWMAKRVGKSGRVLAVEPQPRVASALRDTLESSGLSQASVLHAAASSHDGQGTINIPRDSTHGASLEPLGEEREIDPTPVDLRTIPSIMNALGWDRLDFVKIDAEGHELAIIGGSLEAFRRFRPAILVESEARTHEGDRSHIDALQNMLGPLGYRGQFHDGRRWRPLDELDVSIHQNYGVGRFCNNLFFGPEPAGS